MVVTNGTSTSQHVQRLMDQRANMESELDALADVLKSHNVDMKTPLVTQDGFPRADLDVAQIREVRQRIIRLQNDLRGLMRTIETELVSYFKQKREEGDAPVPSNGSTSSAASSTTGVTGSGGSGTSATGTSAISATGTSATGAGTTSTSTSTRPSIPFARIDSVEPDSPASRAGLEEGDRIVSFGHINASNHQRLQALAPLVAANLNKHIWVAVLRNTNTVMVPLIPDNSWGGRGALGCHIVPL